MKLGDKIKLHIERSPTFSDGKTDITDGEFVVIGISYKRAHCFGDDMWSHGLNSFEYGKKEEGRPDIVREGAIYVPTPDFLDMNEVSDLHHDKKVVSWKVLS
jgi:hypothetical protein